MSEKFLVLNGIEIKYKGVFKFDEFITNINQELENLGYKRHEKEFHELVKPDGKEIFVELRPAKPLTAYFSTMMKIFIKMSKVKETLLDVDGIATAFQEGEINILLDAWTTTDYENRWGMSPITWFIKSFINKYIYPLPLEGKLSGIVGGDARHLLNQIKAHLNLYKYKVAKEHSDK